MNERVRDSFIKWHGEFMEDADLDYDKVIIDDDIAVLGSDTKYFKKTMRDFFRLIENSKNAEMADLTVFSYEIALAKLRSLGREICDLYGITKILYTGLIECGLFNI